MLVMLRALLEVVGDVVGIFEAAIAVGVAEACRVVRPLIMIIGNR